MFRVTALAALAFSAILNQGAAQAQDHAQSLRTEPLEVTTHGRVNRFTVEVAQTDQEREIGLMYRRTLAPDRGMLFEFDATAPESFWMKNTFIPLDIVFIAPDGKVVNIARQATPLSEAPIASAAPVNAVLELRGGRAAEIGLETGDVVHAKFFHN